MPFTNKNRSRPPRPGQRAGFFYGINMTTQPTNLPVPSESPRDLKFNAGKIDEFVTSMALQYIDRFGHSHYTIEGLKQLVLQQIYNLGWNPVGSFQDGATLNAAGDIIQDESTGVWYRWDNLSTLPKTVPSGSTPGSTGGVGEGKWLAVDVSDVLRKDLAKPTAPTIIGAKDIVGQDTILQKYIDKINHAVFLTELSSLAVGSNWTAAFQFVNDNANISCLIIPAGTYNSDVELRPAPYTVIISLGAMINISTANIQQAGIHPKTGTKFLGKLTISLGDTNAYAWQRSHIRIGEYDSGVGDSDIFIEDVTLLGGHIDCNAVFITGDSFNIEFGNIKIPDNAKIGRGFLAHWGGASGLSYDASTNTVTWDGVTYTKHPHNIIVNAMDVGILSAYDTAPAFDKAAVFVSASYNIAFRNLTVVRAGYGYVATGGDYGFVYCGNAQLQLTKQKGLTLDNATFQLTRARGISLSGRTTSDVNGQFYIPSENVNCSVSIKNVTMLGERLNATNGSHQLYMQDVSDVLLDNVSVSGAALKGVWLTGQCQRVNGNVSVTNCNHTSLAVTGSVSAAAKDINIELVSSNENRIGSSDPGLGSAVWLSGCERVKITGRCGNTTSPSNYVNGVQFGSTCVDSEVEMRIGEPSATYNGKCVNGDTFAFSARNRCDRSIILKYGSIAGNFISYDASGHRVITGSTYPQPALG